MTDIRHIFFCLFLSVILLSCSSEEVVSDNSPQAIHDMAFSIGRTERFTRQTVDVVQDEGQAFRGINQLKVLSFVKDPSGPVTNTDEPTGEITTGTEDDRIADKYYYYIENYFLSLGTNHVLVYGQATPKANVGPEENGKLNTTLSNSNKKPANITFSLQSICNTDDATDETFTPAWALADYLTVIVKTPGWSTTTDSQLKALYLSFIHADTDGSGLMCGSAAHIKAYVKALKEQLETLRDASGTADNIKTLCGDIIINIGDTEATASCVNNGYPRSIGLPDAAAVLRWVGGSENKFSVRTQATTLDNINNITRYVHPAELWYYVNSPLCTSEDAVTRDTYQSSTDWETLLAEKYTAGSTIGDKTRSVAVQDPLQYGVSRLQMVLKPITGTLKDAKDDVVNYGATPTTSLPLTGIVIGAQHTMGFDFKPRLPQSDVDGCFIYDTVVGSPDTETGNWIVNTLTLQTYDEEQVPVILEIENKTGQQFTGKDGIVYPNTKFYLIGMVDATNEGSGEYWNRVFTQDHTTQVTIDVKSLANAYTCMPDLLSPRLEIGVEVTTKWVQSSSTTIILD